MPEAYSISHFSGLSVQFQPERTTTKIQGEPMQLLRWDTVKKEDLNDKISRKMIYGEKAMIAEITIAKGGVVPLHHHESEQIACCLEGALTFELEGKEITLRAGDVLVIPSNIPHRAVAVENFRGFDIFSPIRYDWLAGTDDYLRK
jgi:quercetin dioxygenase-like cupin family protein